MFLGIVVFRGVHQRLLKGGFGLAPAPDFACFCKANQGLCFDFEQVVGCYVWWCKAPDSPLWPLVCARLDALATHDASGNPDMVTTKADALKMLRGRGWDLASRQKLLAGAQFAEAANEDYEYRLEDALKCEALPELLRQKARERLQAVVAKRNQSAPRVWSPWELQGKPVEEFRKVLAEKPGTARELLRVEMVARVLRPDVLELIYATLEQTGIPVQTCPDPRCKCQFPDDA